MENASKALLIAGAVLIVILIIGVGMGIFQGSQGSIDAAMAKMGAQEKQIFNAQFENYAGTKKGSQIRALYSAIIASDAQEDNNDTNKFISIALNNTAGAGAIAAAGTTFGTTATTTIPADIASNGTYEVVFGYNNGVICAVSIQRRS